MQIDDKPRMLIESDGTGRGTSIKIPGVDVDLADYVRKVVYTLDGNGFADIVLELAPHRVDARFIGKLKEAIAPDGHIKRLWSEDADEAARLLNGEQIQPHTQRKETTEKELENDYGR